eukprot:5700200-Ditylum_brightwellii.AAC.1
MPPSRTKHNTPQSSSSSSSENDDNIYLPSMIVFDLDDCLWTPEMHELPGYPDIPVQGYLNPSSDSSSSDDDDDEEEVGTIGMQVPRYKTTVKLYTGARRALRELVTNPNYKHIVIGVASTSLEPSYSHACID